MLGKEDFRAMTFELAAQRGDPASNSELRVVATRKNCNWPTIGVVSRIGDELIIEGEARPLLMGYQ